MNNSNTVFGVVAIGRNEGERLKRCLESALSGGRLVVYVDSGSNDGSVEMARGLGVEVVELDMSIPFTAARARNEGFQWLIHLDPRLEYVQFVDGDCEIVGDWLNKARNFLDKHPDVAVVCGRRRERYPDRSVYNMLCDIEWDTPIGEAKACGGDSMMRVAAFREVDGFRSDLIAGEEPELCVRLRQAGWKIWRLDAEMTLHDGAMTHLSQWWKRSERAGYAFAEGALLHGLSPERHWVAESRRIVFWGMLLPVGTIAVSVVSSWLLWIFAMYPMQVVRLALRNAGRVRKYWVYSFFLVLGKFPETLGLARFWVDKISGKRRALIEYKK